MAKDKPETALAKANETLTNQFRKIHPQYDSDVIRFGQRVADFNAGWLVGNSKKKGQKKR